MEKENSNNILMIILLVVVLLLGGFIIYDKLLKKTETIDCPKCEKTITDYANVSIDTKVKLICTIDMNGLTEVNVKDKCGEDFDIKNSEYQIRVKNLNYNGVKYTFTYVLEKDTTFPREDDPGIVKMYVGEILISARDASVYNIFSGINVSGSNLQIKEGTRTSVPYKASNFNLSKIIK